MDIQKQATSVYHSLSLIPTLESACLLPPVASSIPVLIKASQTDAKQAKKRAFLISKSISQKGDLLASAPFPLDVTTASFVAPSPSGRFLAVVRIDGDKKDEPFIEIWDSFCLVRNISCKGKGHGCIYADEWFGTVEWSPDEKYIAYIAEPTVTNSSFWDKDQKDASKLGHKFDYKEDWGEGFIGVTAPSIFILDIEEETILSVKLTNRNLTVGQVIWSPNGKELVFAGWPVVNRRLGLRYCYNRESAIYSVALLDVQNSQQKETDDKSKADSASLVQAHLVSDPPQSRVARFPRFSPDGSTLVYLAAENMLTHNGGAKLQKVDWASKKIETILDTVARPTSENFPGIFVHSLPRRCFLDDSHILSHTQWGSMLVPIVIDLRQKSIQKLAIPDGFLSAVVHDVVDKNYLLVCSSPSVPTTLMFGRFEGKDISANSVSHCVVHKSPENSLLNNIVYTRETITPTCPPVDVPFEVLFTQPKTKPGEKLPLLLFPHGGPHSSFTGEYSTYVAFLASMGYCVISINYRGSLGFGTDFVNVLPGRCGELDVQDCVDAARYALGKSFVDPLRVGVIGGSHGGFLSAHLIGGTFDKLRFKACAMRNPVTNLVSMLSTTDIPDWCFVETGTTKFSPTFVATKDQLDQMYKASPMVNIDKVATPTLFLLGEIDKRVPPSQGIEMYHALLERNIPTRLLVYPKNGHALVGADADPDQAVNTALFLHEHINK